ncbi:hypothetical protein [Haliea sp. E17]|uniref:hypothetical protein n=1 Tax=Haliea sp. E17 TaxID=3401576 RepID=UPI003AAAF7BA
MQRHLHYFYGVPCDVDFTLAVPAPGVPEPPACASPADVVTLSRSACAIPESPLEAERFAVVEHGREVWFSSDIDHWGVPRTGQRYRFSVAGVASFEWEGQGSEIFYSPHGEENPGPLGFWFIHIFLPLYLALVRGYHFFHAGAVRIDGAAVLFFAPSMGGKSTLAAGFLERGHKLLSDDKVAVVQTGQGFYAFPSHPHHRPYRRNEDLGIPIPRFCTAAEPIAAVYILERGSPDGPVTFSALSGFRKFEELLPSYLFNFAGLLQTRTAYLARLVDALPVYQLRRPWSLARTDEVCTEICHHLRSLAPAPA